MISRKQKARIAGIWYLLLAIIGGFGVMYVDMNITVDGDAAEAVQNIIDSGWIFRLSIVSNSVAQVIFIFLALALYRLFKDVDPEQAKLLVILVVVSIPITFLSSLILIAAEMFALGPDYLSVFDMSQQNAMVMWAMKLYDQSMLFAKIFWGLWLLPFGILVIKSKFIPKIFGVLLVLNCFAYLITTFVTFMDIQPIDPISYILIPFIVIGEFAIIFWLLIKGAKETSSHSVSTLN